MSSILFAYSPRRTEPPLRPPSWLYVWAPVVIAVTVIAIESTRTFSAENTSSWLRPLIEALAGHLSDDRWARVHHLIRKSGHFAGFGSVCVTFIRAWLWRSVEKVANSVGRWRWWAVVRGVASTALVASLDEWHQTFLPNRTGKFADVVLDTCGGIAACLVLWIVFWSRDRNTQHRTLTTV